MFRGAFAVLVVTALAVFAPRPAAAESWIPGTGLAIGMSLARVDSLLAFTPEGRQAGRERRHGYVRFFGLRAETKLEFAGGLLVSARFSAPGTSTHSRDYIEDQLHRMGLAHGCEHLDAAMHDCVWTGRSRLRVTWNAGALTAEASASAAEGEDAATLAKPGGSGAGAAEPPPARTAATASAAFLPDTLVLGAKRVSRSQFVARSLVPMATPAYPPAAALAGVQGVVRVLATVDSLGLVTDVVILRGIAELDASALETARRCRLVPLWSAGRRVGYHLVIPITFTRPGRNSGHSGIE